MVLKVWHQMNSAFFHSFCLMQTNKQPSTPRTHQQFVLRNPIVVTHAALLFAFEPCRRSLLQTDPYLGAMCLSSCFEPYASQCTLNLILQLHLQQEMPNIQFHSMVVNCSGNGIISKSTLAFQSIQGTLKILRLVEAHSYCKIELRFFKPHKLLQHRSWQEQPTCGQYSGAAAVLNFQPKLLLFLLE